MKNHHSDLHRKRTFLSRIKTTWLAPTISFFVIVLISVASYTAQSKTAQVQQENALIETKSEAKSAITKNLENIEETASKISSYFSADMATFEKNVQGFVANPEFSKENKGMAFISFAQITDGVDANQIELSFIQPNNTTLPDLKLGSITDFNTKFELAKNSKQAIISKPFVNDQLLSGQSVFVAMIYPIFTTTPSLLTNESTSSNFEGVLVMPIALDLFLDSAQERSQTFTVFRIIDSDNNVIATSNSFFENNTKTLSNTVVSIGDTNLILEYDVEEPSDNESALARKSTLGTGIGLAVIVFLLFAMMRLNERRARRLTEDAEREIYASEARFSALIQESSDITLVLDSKGKIIYISPSVKTKLGYSISQVVGKNIVELVGVRDTMLKARHVIRHLDAKKPVKPFEVNVISVDGRVLTFECVVNDLRNDNAVNGIVCNSRDITERKIAEAQVVKAKALYESALENAPIGVALVHQDGQCFFTNDALLSFLGKKESEVNNTRLRDFIYQDDQFAFSEMWKIMEQRGTESITKELRFVHPDGRQRWGYISAQGAYDDGVFQYFIVQIEDTTERRSIAERLEYQAIHDPLTGLPNRLLFVDRLEVALLRSKRTGLGVAVLFLDLDRFKVVNDSLGHAAGDRLLIAVAERIKTSVRPNDTLARFGGDEFVILCEDISEERQTNEIATRLLENINRPIMLEDGEVYVTASIGIARSLSGEDTPETILRDADTAMYRAKDSGRNRSEVFDERTHARAVANLETGNGMFRALSENEFRLRYQPIVSLKSGRLSGFEALVYWQHPQRGHIGPNDFITLAEETGVIVPLGLKILEEACHTIQRWNSFTKESSHLTMSVNLSPRQLVEPTFVDEVAKILERTKVNPSRIWFEITETALMVDADSTISMLDRLKNLGVHFEVDDFGTGFSSLSYLKKFPVDALKIDQGFIDGLGRDPEDTAIVTAVISLSHALGLQAIAEGVETPLQMAELKTLGCEYAQGYLFAKPNNAHSWDDAVRSNELFQFAEDNLT